MRYTPSLFLALCTAICLATPAAHADWGDWGDLVDDAKEALGKTKDTISEAAESLLDSESVKKAKAAWESLEINERLRYAFGDDIDTKAALTGHFFDLKRPVPKAKDSKGNPVRSARPGDIPGIIREFLDKGWDGSVLTRYYSPEVKLLAPYFYLPRCKASYAPFAFQCDTAKNAKPVRPSCWVVLYQGVIVAPKTGKFRFVGMCDDTMIVRFNRNQVLESGWYIPTRGDGAIGTDPGYRAEVSTRKENPLAFYCYEETPHWNKHLGGIASGIPFEVKKGESYPIEILLSEIPGSEFGFVLLVEELKDDVKSGTFQPWEAPKLHLFRTNGTLPEEELIRNALGDYLVGDNIECAPFDKKKSLVWKLNTEESEKTSFFDRLLGDVPDKSKQTAMGTQDSDSDNTAAPAPAEKKKQSKKSSSKRKRK